MLTGGAADGTHKQCLMPIFRNPHGHFSALGRAVAPPAQPTERFLAHRREQTSQHIRRERILPNKKSRYENTTPWCYHIRN